MAMPTRRERYSISSKISWRTVPNTVRDRMVDHSLIHKLIPCTRIRKRTKAMKYSLRRLARVKTYKEYVKLKTSILLNFHSDSDTDDSILFSDDDYSRIYTSDVSLSTYVTKLAEKNKSYTIGEKCGYVEDTPDQKIAFKANLLADEDIPLSEKIGKARPAANKSYRFEEKSDKGEPDDEDTPLYNRIPKMKPITKTKQVRRSKVIKPKVIEQKHEVVNFGWQKVIKKKKKITCSALTKLGNDISTSSSRNHFIEGASQAAAQSYVSQESLISNIEDSNLDDHKPSNVEIFLKSLISESDHEDTMELNCKTENLEVQKSDPLSEIKTEVGAVESIVDKDHNISDSNHSGAVEAIKKNLMQDLDNCNTKPNTQDYFNGHRNRANDTFLDRTQLSQLNASPINQSTPLYPKRQLPQIQQSLCKTNQPKDSGIDEDSEDESSEDTKRINKKLKVVTKEVKQEVQVPLSIHNENNSEEKSSEVEKCITQSLEIDTEEVDQSVQAPTSMPDQSDSEEESLKVEKSIMSELKMDTEENEHSSQTSSPTHDKSDSENESDQVEKSITRRLEIDTTEINENVQAPSPMSDQSDSKEEFSEVGECITQTLEESTEETKHSEESFSSGHDQNDLEEKSSEDETPTNKESKTEETMPQPSSKTSSDESHNVTIQGDSNISNEKEHSEVMHKQKMHPTVTSTEIVNKRYKIVSGTDSTFYVQRELNKSEDVMESCGGVCEKLVNDKYADKVEHMKVDEQTEDEDMECSISPTSMKRLQQLKRLNLTADSDSSEESTGHSDIGRTRKKSLDHSEIFFHLSDTDEELTDSEQSASNLCNKENRTEDDISKDNSNNNRLKNITRNCSQDLDESHTYDESENTLEREPAKIKSSQGYSKNDTPKRTKTKEKSNVETEEIASHKEVSIAKKVSQKRPSNLEEFITGEGLVEIATPTNFSFKDINEDEIFILDIPAAILQNQLMGERIVLTEKKLKLGKQKYKVAYKNANPVSCVFRTRKTRKPYKTVNVTPVAIVAAREKIENSTTKSSREYPTETESYTENTADAENNRNRFKKHHKTKHKSAKKKRLKSSENDE